MSSPPFPPGDGEHLSRPRRGLRQRLLVGSGVVVVVALLAGVAVVGYVWWRFSQIQREDLAVADAGDREPKNYLIVGSDSREVIDERAPDAAAFIGDHGEGGGKRSDTIMIVRVDPIAGTIDMLSFPRDLWLPIAGTDSRERINTAYGYEDGPQRLIDTIHQNFGIEINHYIEVDFRSFKGVVEAVGGVPIYFDRPMRDTSSGLYVETPGCVKLDGEQALAFARARHLQYRDARGRWLDDPTGDLGRISRQQVFMRRLVDRAAAATGGFDLQTMNSLLSSIAPNLKVDKGLQISKLLNLSKQFKQFSGDQLRTHTLPVEPFTTAGGASVLRLDEVAAEPILDIFRGGTAPSTNAASLVVENGSGVSGQAAQAAKALQALGFTVTSTGDASTRLSHTTVRYAPGAQVAATQIARLLANGAALREDPSLPPGQVVVVTGSDFKIPTTIVTTATTTGSQGRASGTTTAASGTAAASVAASSEGSTGPGEPDPVGVVPGDAPEGVSCG